MKRVIILFVITAFFLCGCSENTLLLQLESGFGSTVVRIDIKDMGSVDVRLFDDDSSDAYKLFVDKIEDGVYTDSSVSVVIDDYLMMIRAGGIPENMEISEELKTSKMFKPSSESGIYPIYGSVVLSENFSVDGSFMIVAFSEDGIEELESMLLYKGITLSEYLLNAYGIEFTEEGLDIYRAKGGAPWLYGVYPCVGQVFGGMDLVEKILRETNIADESYRPTEKIIVSGIGIVG
ncbi:MAG: peptidylprolyl isomerase [Lachnospiraceae bacterium]|nr:peptidylprolyl isomerase [Lachnospiraceae bacterium]